MARSASIGWPRQRRMAFLLPGDWSVPTGGYRYDRRIVRGLVASGWAVDVLALDASFPAPHAQALAHAEAQAAALPDGSLAVVDGLAFGAMPEVAQRHTRRLCWVALVHHPLHLETGLDEARRRRLLEDECRALAAARRVICTSASTAGALTRMGVPPGRIAVVEPGTDRPDLTGAMVGAETGGSAGAEIEAQAQAKTQAQAEETGRIRTGLPGAGGGLRLLCVATLTPRKGHRVLLDALAGLRDRAWTLRCVGSLARDASTAQAVRRAIHDHGLADRVLLDGELDDEALAARYRQADAFVLASFHEGYGMALAEALAHGLPVVGTAAGAIVDTVPPQAGILVPAGDVAALRAALARLLDDAGWRAAAAAASRRAGEHLPDWDEACRRFAAALDAALGDTALGNKAPGTVTGTAP